MDLKRITLLCSIFIAINAFVNGEKQVRGKFYDKYEN